MLHSQNGWPASGVPAEIHIAPLVVAGASFPGGVAHWCYNAYILKYVATQFHYRVEKLRPGWCWGYYFRSNRNDPNSLSNHSAGSAIDCNAPLHPNGVATAKTFSAKQIAEIGKILDEVNGLGFGQIVRWGGDYQRTVDAMHFEIVGSQQNTIRAGAKLYARNANKVPVVQKVITAIKPRPKKRVAVKVATGRSVVNLGAIFRGAAANDDVRDLQRVLNAWFPHEKVEVDGLYGDATYALLDHARKGFKIAKPVSDRAARRATVRKLGFRTVG